MIRVVVIDDDGCFTQLVSEVLALEGWETISCYREGEAMECVREQQPDVILLDLHIDSMESGWILMQALRKDERTRQIPIILCTATAPWDVHRQAPLLQQLNVKTVLKPFNIDDLTRAIEQAVDQPQPAGEQAVCALSEPPPKG
jgi:twitching motility two-component system response regulator PilH